MYQCKLYFIFVIDPCSMFRHPIYLVVLTLSHEIIIYFIKFNLPILRTVFNIVILYIIYTRSKVTTRTYKILSICISLNYVCIHFCILLKITIISVYLFDNNLRSAIKLANVRLKFLKYQHGADVPKVIISLGDNNYYFSRYCQCHNIIPEDISNQRTIMIT